MNVTEQLSQNLHDRIQDELRRLRAEGHSVLDHPRISPVKIQTAFIFSAGLELNMTPEVVNRTIRFICADAMGAIPGKDSSRNPADWVGSLADTRYQRIADDFYEKNLPLIAEWILEADCKNASRTA